MAFQRAAHDKKGSGWNAVSLAPIADGLQTTSRQCGDGFNASKSVENFGNGREARVIHAPRILHKKFERKGFAYPELRGLSNAVVFEGMKEPRNVESREGIGYRLELTRLALEMSKTAFAASFGVTPQGYTNYFTKGRSDRITPEDATRLCRIHGVSMDWIYRGHMYAVRGDLRDKIERIMADFDSKGHRARETS